MLKKIALSLSITAILVGGVFATEISIQKTPTLGEQLIQMADQAIAKGTISTDKLITALQTIHQGQKSELSKALELDNKVKAQKTLTQWNDMYELTNHLYDIKAGSGINLTDNQGQSYTFKRQTELGWLNLLRGDEEYYRFPVRDTFLELDFTFNQSGTIKQDTNISGSYPTYFYDGDNYLTDLTRKDAGLDIKESKNADQTQYFFFDLTNDTATNVNTKLSINNGGSVNLNQIYNSVSYSPNYFLVSLDAGFQYCQKVAQRIGDKAKDKEYGVSECTDAANSKFYTGMNQQILDYAVSTISNK
ncbi:hypothetical protein AGMMS50249_1070 [candidate division SR1 bacterium]|nr:hypothetical protein AGMMS50249_1070 [candidate division SR1 bacterium]